MSEPAYRVLTGPFHFAWAGYGDVDFLLFEPTVDESFLVLFESDNSFSALEAIKDDCRGRSCYIQAGYAAGWCSEATGLPTECSELACRAEGVSHCRFLVAHHDRVEEQIRDPRMHRPTKRYTAVPARIPHAAGSV